jgi:hypothetical protein
MSTTQNQLSLSLRYERKFAADGLAPAQVLAMVRLHPSAFRESYPARLVNNIYLDFAGLNDYRDHISGAAIRSKTRVRWYGPQRGLIERPMLERKLKRGLANTKETYALPALSLDGMSVQSALNGAFDRAGLPEMLRSFLRRLEPATANRYRRHYFVSADGRFRLTVDSELQFLDAGPNNGAAAVPPVSAPVVIVELKFAPDSLGHAGLVIEALPFRLTRCSKYVLGIERMAALQPQATWAGVNSFDSPLPEGVGTGFGHFGCRVSSAE